MRAALVLLVVSGCASPAGFGRATTLPAGEAEAQAALTASVATVRHAPGDPTPLPWLDLEAGFHYGVTDDVEIGGRLFGVGIRGLGMWGVAADAKVSLLRADAEEGGGWNIAVATALGYHQLVIGGTPLHMASFTIPVLFGYDLGRDQLVFGPRLMGQLLFGQGQGTVETLTYGLGVGYSIALGDSFQLMPELVLGWTPVSFNGEVQDDDRYGAGFLHLAVGGSYRL